MSIPKIDGSRFWNPYEGVKAGADLIKFMRGCIESDALVVPGRSKQQACAYLSSIERHVKATVPKLKALMGEWGSVRAGRKVSAHPIFLNEQEREVLRQLRLRVEELRITIEQSSGQMKLFDLAISYPTAEIEFTPESYFDFVFRSLDEILASAKDGKVIGPVENQSW